jgi:hypothetical protein
MKNYYRLIAFVAIHIAWIIIAACLTGCVPNVTYKGKYGDYTATPEGVTIRPHYAK